MHTIITILTMFAVALHAMLGCCAHHQHVCLDTHGMALPVQHLHEGCSHVHGHHHRDSAESASEDSSHSEGHRHQHDGGPLHDCDEGKCDVTYPQRLDYFELEPSLSNWCLPLCGPAHVDGLHSLVAMHSTCMRPPDPLVGTGVERFIIQVWRL